MLIAHDTLVMAVDGARMSLYRNTGTQREPRFELLAQEHFKAPPTADLAGDRPGSTFQSASPARSAYETTDWHQRLEDEFAEEMAELFNFHMADNSRKGVLIAPPKVLGKIRKHLRPETRAQLIGEIGKDYAGRTPLEIAELLDRLD